MGQGTRGRLARHIVLIGMMGAGKTAVGSETARRLGVPFTDSDAEIEAAAAMSISEIFARDGETFFRDRETQVLSRILNGPPGIVSTGGGAWMRPENRALIRKHGLAVWIDCDLETLWHRVRQRPTRPLLQTADPKGTLAALIETRAPVYAKADLVFQSRAGDTIEAAAIRMIDQICTTRPDMCERITR
ncbi:MAG: shikimate kinase [Paracoccus sp. (in: a-proteobacteria)]|uniref:shikimate kinase n=1 Tax=Paracoccus sp. TaxID=267 RepID=UPI0026DF7526|nr:shikimate kinase [Paracoccus sp. (in: a-proteobacteria)]MDO5631480.1 shikimate kinase [Paracoccus sp. (in: a-proteobacteria)]